MSFGLKGFLQLSHLVQDLRVILFGLVDRNHNDLDRGQSRRKDKSVVIAVSHHEGSHKPRGNAPGCGPHVLLQAFLVCIFHIERLGEVLAEEMRCSGLESLPVLHHRLDGKGVERAGESLVRTLVSHDHRQSHKLTSELRVHLNHSLCLFLSLLRGRVGRVALLPKEFGGAEEKPCAHLPADNVSPLVAHDREIPP